MKKHIFNTIITSNNSYITSKPVFNDKIQSEVKEKVVEEKTEEKTSTELTTPKTK